jgi:hypothetical protein
MVVELSGKPSLSHQRRLFRARQFTPGGFFLLSECNLCAAHRLHLRRRNWETGSRIGKPLGVVSRAASFMFSKSVESKVQTFETTDAAEAQRCKRAQYTGRIATMVLAGSTVTGIVISVVEDASCSPKKWIVNINPTSLPTGFTPSKKLRASRW